MDGPLYPVIASPEAEFYGYTLTISYTNSYNIGNEKRKHPCH